MQKRKITKKEITWIKTMISGGLGYLFVVKPLADKLDYIIPNGNLRVFIGLILILGIVWLWDF